MMDQLDLMLLKLAIMSGGRVTSVVRDPDDDRVARIVIDIPVTPAKE